MKRTGGITTLGVLGIVFGLVGALLNGGIFLAVLLVKYTPPPPADDPQAAMIAALAQIGGLVFLSILCNVVTAVMIFISGVAMFRLRAWARLGYIAACVATLINRLLMFPMHLQAMGPGATSSQIAAQVAGTVGDAVNMAFCVAAVWYLTRPRVAERFAPAASTRRA